MSYFSVNGLVSGIKSHMIEAPSKATAAILRNVVVWPKLAAIRPKTAVLRAAPIPEPTAAVVMSAVTSAVSTPIIAPLMP